jgi:pantoate--beta-alanine ligase
MILFKKANDLSNYLDELPKENKTIGFVPTMGALHRGHLSLIEAGKLKNDILVCSIFVNPTQFNDKKDFEKYPITIEQDIYQLEKAGCDVLFLPSVNEIYPDENSTKAHYELGYLETVLEGKYRPGHFQGVCMVVNRLLNIVKPDDLYLGQKDYQQCMVISKLIELTGMNHIKINICPTLREDDGLAMSSRNMRLSDEERKKSNLIFQTLQFIRSNIREGNLEEIKDLACTMLLKEGFKIDYVEIANSNTLQPVEQWNGSDKMVALIAAFLNEVRLIDNMLLN